MAQAAASSVNKEMEMSMERLSTGKRINSAADDAAGVAIASRLTSEIKGTNQAIRNAMDGQAMIDTAEGAHQEIEFILQRMRELAVQASNDSNSDADRTALQSEVDALVSEIDRIANVSTWAGKGLIDAANSFKFNVGSHGGGHNEITATTTAMTGAALGVASGNASVGVNGATAIEVGESDTGVSTVQFGGTPAVGDVYSMDLNGQTITLEIAAVSGNNFTYKFKADGVAYDSNATGAYSNATNDVVGDGAVTGQTTTSVATAFAQVINGSDITGGDVNGDVVATVNADGTLTIGKSINFGQKTGDAAHTTHDDGDGLTTNTITDNGTGTVVFEMTAASGKFPEDIDISINNVDISASVEAAGAYAGSAAGAIAALQAAIDAKVDSGELAGMSFTVAAGTTGEKIKITAVHDTSGLVSNVGVNPGTTTAALQINSQANASGAIATIDSAIEKVNAQRASLGAISNRLDSTVNNLTSISSNLQAGRGRIEDADFAAETTSLAKSQILQQASTAMLAQANASKQNVLSLLQG
jgi:flagellin